MVRLPRIEKFLKKMGDHVDVSLISLSSNFSYFAGVQISATMERPVFLVIGTNSEPTIIAPRMYLEELLNVGTKIVTWEDSENPFSKLSSVIGSSSPKKIGIESQIPFSIYAKIRKSLKGASLKIIDNLLSDMRITKDSEEISYLKRAGEIVDRTFYKLIDERLEGMSELEVSLLIKEFIERYEGDGISFEPIVASGTNSSHPHHTSGKRKIEKGDLVVLDYGAKYNNYCSDITRTVGIANVDPQMKSTFEIVKKAHDSGIESIEEGIKAEEIDKVVRSIISEKGFGSSFIHRTGHGIGLDVHEEPYIVQGNTVHLMDGMVFTVEPGIYLEGKYGVRIEDDVFLHGGPRTLTNASTNFFVL